MDAVRASEVSGELTLRRAAPGDLAAVCALLDAAGLPSRDVHRHFHHFVLAYRGERLCGAGGLEIDTPVGLLRSVVVAPAERGQGMATAICDRLEANARASGVRDLYLLTETAADFFARRGYRMVAREGLPAAIASCEQLLSLCPQRALVMHKPIAAIA